ncbi:hypothetical protein [Pseudoalteromonas gelatinilytica]
MPKKTVEILLWHHRTKRTLSRKGKKYNPNKEKKIRVLGYEYLLMPKKVDLYSESNYQATTDFVNKMLSRACSTAIMLDFEQTEHITAAALLYLYSRIDHCLSENPKARIRIKADSLRGIIKETVMKSGLFARTLNRTDQVEDNGNSRIVKGTAEGEEFEEVIDHIVKHIYKVEGTEAERQVGAAVSESVGNVKLHAYPREQDNTAPFKPWWILYSVIDGVLYLAIYDIGVGIPETIHSRNWIRDIVDKTPDLLRKLSSSRDVDHISVAMEAGKTQTKEKKHGKGSKSIRALVDATPNGMLRVFSNKGLYQIGVDAEPELIEHGISVGGTLIQWNIKI